jgi:hypothetical protein
MPRARNTTPAATDIATDTVITATNTEDKTPIHSPLNGDEAAPTLIDAQSSSSGIVPTLDPSIPTTEVPPAATGFFDNLEALRQAYAVPQEESGVIASIEPRKPSPGVWFRTHPSPEYQLPGRIIEDRENRNAPYLLAPHLIGKYPDDEKSVLLTAYITRQAFWASGLSISDRSKAAAVG